MITGDDLMIGVQPRIPGTGFVEILAAAGSFNVNALWGPYCGRSQREMIAIRCYEVMAAHEIDPAVLLAFAAQEHGYGTNADSVLWRHDTHSWGNATTIRNPVVYSGPTESFSVFDGPRQREYIKYKDVVQSVLDICFRLKDPGFVYAMEGRRTITQVVERYAPDSPLAYVEGVTSRVNRWIGGDWTP